MTSLGDRRPSLQVVWQWKLHLRKPRLAESSSMRNILLFGQLENPHMLAHAGA